MEYIYPAGDDRQITQSKDWMTGEEVTYAYDSLSRLISALTTGPEWGQSYGYDGFGNRTTVTVTKGTAPSGNLTIDPMTNRITNPGFSYDANGNLTAMPLMSMSYDVANRVLSVSGDTTYAYDAENRRVWKAGPREVYYYGVDGRRLGAYRMTWGAYPPATGEIVYQNVYFAGRLIKAQGKWVATNRLGSVVKIEGERLRYVPWGEEQATTTQNREKFGTYFRDSTGLDYADQRYYSNSHGRFLTPDPYVSSGGAPYPQSWNPYAYVENDPGNYSDSTGVMAFPVDVFVETGGGWGGDWALICADRPGLPDLPKPFICYVRDPIMVVPVLRPPAPPSVPSGPAQGPATSPNQSAPEACSFTEAAVLGFQQGMTQVMTMPCPVPIPQVCVIWTIIRIVVYAAAAVRLLVDAFQRRGQTNPYTFPRTNPGRDAAGNCNACPPDGPAWEEPGDVHGPTGGSHWHWIKYNQNSTTCECFPTRMDFPTRP